MRAVVRRCLMVVLVAAMLAAAGFSTAVEVVSARTSSAADAATSDDAPGDGSGFSARPQAAIPDRAIGPAAAIVASPALDALARSWMAIHGPAASLATRPRSASVADVHPTPIAHLTPLLI